MSLPTKRISEILQAAADSATAIRSLYQSMKADDARVSLNSICRKAGISSKGYLSDVMHSRRTLNLAYKDKMALALNLRGLHHKYFALLVERDHERRPEQVKQLNDELQGIRKSFAINMELPNLPLAGDSLAFEVFCAFGLYQGKPKRDDLVQYFGRARAFEIDQALHSLQQAGLIRTQDGVYILNCGHLLFGQSEDDEAQLQFLRQALDDAKTKAPQWYPRPESSHFESVVISVKRSEYLTLLQRLKANLLQWQSELESADADMLIRFNVQVYPCRDADAE